MPVRDVHNFRRGTFATSIFLYKSTRTFIFHIEPVKNLANAYYQRYLLEIAICKVTLSKWFGETLLNFTVQIFRQCAF